MNSKNTSSVTSEAKNNILLTERLQAAVELLEAVARDRALLASVPEEERTRLLHAAGQVSRPDAIARRRLRKAQIR
ncbi:MAG: oxidoreductase, partial [Verrucomicrobiota bacterium]